MGENRKYHELFEMIRLYDYPSPNPNPNPPSKCSGPSKILPGPSKIRPGIPKFTWLQPRTIK